MRIALMMEDGDGHKHNRFRIAMPRKPAKKNGAMARLVAKILREHKKLILEEISALSHTGMTAKNFKDLADHLRLEILPNIPCAETRLMLKAEMARFCKSQNARFDKARWMSRLEGDSD